jgi:hypothetical protein
LLYLYILEWCKDNSIRGLKCKHLWGIEFAVKWGTIKEINKLPPKAKHYLTRTTIVVAKSYIDYDYTF